MYMYQARYSQGTIHTSTDRSCHFPCTDNREVYVSHECEISDHLVDISAPLFVVDELATGAIKVMLSFALFKTNKCNSSQRPTI